MRFDWGIDALFDMWPSRLKHMLMDHDDFQTIPQVFWAVMYIGNMDAHVLGWWPPNLWQMDAHVLG